VTSRVRINAFRGLAQLALALVTCGSASAQVSVRGTVRLFGGAAPPDLTVSLAPLPPATGHRSVSALDGNFDLPQVSPGEYDLGIVSQGKRLFLERSRRSEVELAQTLRVTIPGNRPSFRLEAIVAHDLSQLQAPAHGEAARCLTMLAGRKPSGQSRAGTSLVLTRKGMWYRTYPAGLAAGALVCITEETEQIGQYVTAQGQDAGKAVAFRWNVRLLRPDGRIVSTKIGAEPPEKIQVRTDRRGNVVEKREINPDANFHLRAELERWLKVAGQ
jgi:hypothetical protein